jgi:hypothetical protein
MPVPQVGSVCFESNFWGSNCPDCRDAHERYYRNRVTSSDLKREQVEALARTLGRNLRYLNRLCARMQRLRFPMDDPVCQAAHQAREAMHKLYTEAYMAGERRAVGR